jgi:hypothetical protein
MLSRNGEEQCLDGPLPTSGRTQPFFNTLGNVATFPSSCHFNVVTVRELLGKYHGLIIISAVQVDRILNMVVASNQVGTIFGHVMHHRLHGSIAFRSPKEAT